MSTNITAYELSLIEIRFNEVHLSIPDFNSIGERGRVQVETGLRFGIGSDVLYCTLSMKAQLLKEEESEDDLAPFAQIDLGAIGKFQLSEEHGLTSKDMSSFSPAQVQSFSKILEPVLLTKLKSLLKDAGLDGGQIPLQLTSNADDN